MATIYGSHLYGSHVYGSHVYGSHIGSSYLSRKHLKRAIKYGSYGLAAPVVASSEATAAPVVHAPLYGSRYYYKGGYRSSNFYGSYLPTHVTSTVAAPVVTSTVAAPLYYSHSRQASYFAHKVTTSSIMSFCMHNFFAQKAAKYGSYYGSHVLPAATIVSSEAAPVTTAAPIIYGSHNGLYGSSRKVKP